MSISFPALLVVCGVAVLLLTVHLAVGVVLIVAGLVWAGVVAA